MTELLATGLHNLCNGTFYATPVDLLRHTKRDYKDVNRHGSSNNQTSGSGLSINPWELFVGSAFVALC